jgi:hypothetical protein
MPLARAFVMSASTVVRENDVVSAQNLELLVETHFVADLAQTHNSRLGP